MPFASWKRWCVLSQPSKTKPRLPRGRSPPLTCIVEWSRNAAETPADYHGGRGDRMITLLLLLAAVTVVAALFAAVRSTRHRENRLVGSEGFGIVPWIDAGGG